jgi:DNA-binding transcriptional regulator YdaS (Cro superfamily)
MTSAEDEQARLRAELRAVCDSLGYGGQSKLARMIGVDPRTIRNKLSGSTPITESDALAIQKAVEMAEAR